MKRVLIVILSLYNGGAEKSLVNMLNELPRDKYQIDLLLFRREGMFIKQVPDWVNILETPYNLKKLYGPLFESGNMFWTKLLGTVISRMVESKPYMRLGYRWKHFYSKRISNIPGKYDVAIAYTSNEIMHFVGDKVEADKKIVWIHNDFKSAEHSMKYDYEYYKKMDIVTISQECAKIIDSELSSLHKKVYCIANITSSTQISRRAGEFYPMEYENGTLNILSVGRLNRQKGFDMAIEAAEILKNRGYSFKWFIVGNGELEHDLKKLIHERKVEDCVELLGVRDNPYPYILNCDILAQTSRFEGKSVVLDEAKILATPILVTNYPTVHDQIEDGKEGLIVDMNPDSIADGLEKLIEDEELRRELRTYLNAREYGNQEEIKKYIALIGE